MYLVSVSTGYSFLIFAINKKMQNTNYVDICIYFELKFAFSITSILLNPTHQKIQSETWLMIKIKPGGFEWLCEDVLCEWTFSVKSKGKKFDKTHPKNKWKAVRGGNKTRKKNYSKEGATIENWRLHLEGCINSHLQRGGITANRENVLPQIFPRGGVECVYEWKILRATGNKRIPNLKYNFRRHFLVSIRSIKIAIYHNQWVLRRNANKTFAGP